MKRNLWFLMVAVCLLMLLLGGCKASNVNLVISVDGDGTTTPAAGNHSIAKNTVVTLTATPATGSVFSHWAGPDGASVSEANTILMDDDKAITAVFVKLQHSLTITVTPSGAGTVTEELVTDRSYDFGQTIHLTPVPNTGYVFDHWAGTDAADVTAGNDILMDSDKSLEAVFVLCNLTVQSQPGNTGVGQFVPGQNMPGYPTAKVSTSGGNPVSGITVTVAEKSGASISGTISRTTDADGLAVFNDLVFAEEGIYILVFSSVGLEGAASGSFTVDLAGIGTAGNPYLIHNLFGLDRIRNNLFAVYRLENDIDAAATGTAGTPYWNDGKGWSPIGRYPNYPALDNFGGTIDGNGHTISNLHINRPGEAYVGLFGVSSTGTPVIKNLALTNVSIIGGDYTGGVIGAMMHIGGAQLLNCMTMGTVSGTGYCVGGLAGFVRGGTVSGCWSSATVSGASDRVGGLIGGVLSVESTTTIIGCYATGDVQGSYEVGGLLGLVQGADINRCYASGSVVATNGGIGYAGGLAGRLDPAAVSHCYAWGSVSGRNEVGGFAGYADGAILSYCYSTGDVTCGDTSSSGNYGGFMAGNSYGMAQNCFYDRTVCGLSDTTCGTVPKTTTELQTPGTFSGWDTSIWNVIAGAYPTLKP